MSIPFIDLGKQYKEIKAEVSIGLEQVLRKGNFILGEEEKKFEEEFARYCGTKYAVGVNSGTDALFLALLSLGAGKADEVIVPAFTYIASALAVSYTGAKPVFVDIEEGTYNLNVKKVEKAITKKTKAIMPVHLYGHSVNMEPLLELAKKYNLKIVEDCAQAHGAIYKFPGTRHSLDFARDRQAPGTRRVGSIGDAGCFSFYPTKNLGAAGDGGMVVTDNQNLFDKLLMLRDYGRKSRYEHIIKGYNSRLDTLQAVILSAKLKRLDKWNQMRRQNAGLYCQLLKEKRGIILPQEERYCRHVYHIFAIRIKNREHVLERLKEEGISALVHYPIPLHLQEAYRELNYKRGDFPVAERVSKEVISLPMYPHLGEKDIQQIAALLARISDKK